jgi:hypothetical protein
MGVLFDPEDFSTLSFEGPDSQNALYTQFLEFPRYLIPDNGDGTRNFSRLGDYFDVPDHFTIYYLSAGVDGVDISLQLDGQLDGRFRRVEESSFDTSEPSMALSTGPSSVIQVNRALRYSTQIDSDGDGVVNALDPTPFQGVVIHTKPVTIGGEALLELSWNGAANTSYELQASTDAGGKSWETLSTVQNQKAEPGSLKAYDKIKGNHQSRLYRVLYRP